jgi:hypothetical protein
MLHSLNNSKKTEDTTLPEEFSKNRRYYTLWRILKKTEDTTLSEEY